MADDPRHRNKTLELFLKVNSYTSIMGLLNVWGENTRLPVISKNRFYKIFYQLMNIAVYLMMLMELVALHTQKALSDKQKSDLAVFAFSHPLLYLEFLSVVYYRKTVEGLLQCLVVSIKEVYNDEEVEEKMIRKSKIYMFAYLFLCFLSLILYGFDSFLQAVRSGKGFVTVVTAWPDVNDVSSLAQISRIAIYVVWWVMLVRSSNAYVLAISSIICLSHQFSILHSYYNDLASIFKENLSQRQKEEKYEKALKIGVKLHSDTLWCARELQTSYGFVYSGQIIISLTGLALLVLQMVNAERTIFNVCAVLVTASTILVTTGIFMWNAGDVTVEASHLSTAMYSSGWQYVERESSARVRKLLVVAMTQAQKPVIIRGCGIIELSYQSYVSIVKSSYSVFSFIY